jgi:hypothetical protein
MRISARLAMLAVEHAPTQILTHDDLHAGERAFATQLRDFVMTHDASPVESACSVHWRCACGLRVKPRE